MIDINQAPHPILYSFRRCPYAMRARMGLYVTQIEVELREVVLRDKPDAMLDASPKGSVPVLVLPESSEQRVIDESLDIVKYALQTNDPNGFLACDTQLSKALIAENDSTFKQALDRYKYPNRYPDEDTSSARDQGEEFIKKLNDVLKNSNGLTNDSVSYTDICIFPFIRQFANTDREWFDSLPYKQTQRWLEFHLESYLFKAIMPKYDQWKDGDTPVFFGMPPQS